MKIQKVCASFLIGAMMLSLAACSGSTKKIESPADFEGAKISVQTATSAHESIQDMQDEGMNINVLPYEKVTQCFDDLALAAWMPCTWTASLRVTTSRRTTRNTRKHGRAKPASQLAYVLKRATTI